MENREQQILSEIKSMVASIRSQLEKLDAKMVEFHQAVDPEGFKTESINVIIDDIDMLAPPVEPEIATLFPERDSVFFSNHLCIFMFSPAFLKLLYIINQTLIFFKFYLQL